MCARLSGFFLPKAFRSLRKLVCPKYVIPESVGPNIPQ
jgi:hypothetical protein